MAVPGDTLMVWQPGSYQYYGNAEHGYNHSWVHCAGPLVGEAVDACGIPLDMPIAGLAGERFEHHLRSIHYECDQPVRPDERIVENHIRSLVCEVQRAQAAGTGSAAIAHELLAVRRHIESRYAEKITLPQLARIACVSPAHLCVQFRKKFGCSPVGYLLNVRLSQAAYLLQDRNLRVREVAYRVGIGDVYYFSKIFKRRYGKSPREMRSNSRPSCHIWSANRHHSTVPAAPCPRCVVYITSDSLAHCVQQETNHADSPYG